MKETMDLTESRCAHLIMPVSIEKRLAIGMLSH
jgi:hypothetical protein